MTLRDMLTAFRPGLDAAPLAEKIRSAVAVLLGLLLPALLLHYTLPHAGYLGPSLMASMGAAAVLLYAAPHSPMAQPWPLLVGNLLSGVIGMCCALWIPDPIWAAACAAGIAVFVMHLARSLHPPGAATAMIMVANADAFNHHGWGWALAVVAANALLALLLALSLNNLIRRGRYPVPARHKPVTAADGLTLKMEDVEWVLRQMEWATDVDEAELLEIYRLAAEHAKSRMKDDKRQGQGAPG